MAFEGINPFDVFKAVRRVSEGLQLERVFRGLSFVVHEWSKFGVREDVTKTLRKGRYGKPDKGQLTVIEFDKLNNVVCRVWTKLFQATGLPLLDKIETLDEVTLNKIVRFKPPLEEYPGLHGPGEGRRKKPSGKIVYVVSMLKALSEVEDIPYFVFSAGPRTASKKGYLLEIGSHDNLPNLSDEEPNHHEVDFSEATKAFGFESTTFVTSGLHVTEDQQFWDGFTNKEAQFLQGIANAIKHLGPTEIRALGTHKDTVGTLEEVQRELKWARRKGRTIATALPRGKIDLRDAQRLHMAIDEAIRKSDANRRDYENAYDLMIKELEDESIRDAFKRAQQPATEVWRDTNLPALCDYAKSQFGLGQFLHALAYFQRHIRERKVQSKRVGRVMSKQWTQGVNALARSGYRGLPRTPAEAFEVSNAIKSELITILLKALNALTKPT